MTISPMVPLFSLGLWAHLGQLVWSQQLQNDVLRAGRTVLPLDGPWRLTNEGIGPLPSRTFKLLNGTLSDAPRGSWGSFPAPLPVVKTVLAVLPGVKTAEACCSACAKTPLCGSAVWDGSSCSARSANSAVTSVAAMEPASGVSQRGAVACVLSGGAVALNTTVPGDVNDEMMKTGLLPDLLISTNSMDARWVPQYEWKYEKDFAVPAAWAVTKGAAAAAGGGGGGSVALHFGGVDFNCSVELNGESLVRHHTGSFRPMDFDISSIVKAAGSINKLSVVIHAPPAGYLNALFTTNPLTGGAKPTAKPLVRMQQYNTLR